MNRSAALIVLTALATAPVAVIAESDADLEAVRTSINERFPQIARESVKTSEVPGFYEIQQGVIVAYVSKDGRYLVQGTVIDLETEEDLTARSAASGRRDIMAGVSAEGILFSPEDPKYTVTVFTDIDCGFCRKLHQQMSTYNDMGIAVRYLMYPRSGPNTRSWEKAEEVWCADDRLDAMTRAKSDQALPKAECDDATDVINAHFEAGLSVGLSGTPAIVLDDGTLISGFMPPGDLLVQLDAKAAPESGGDR